ncbi:MAG: hypothetical protein HY561_01180 [Gemmatimonadetes bacterium]|nr:hypothetical protein [Gemmatimonadota bacterium]
MDWVRLHLLVNHFPIILGLAGALAVVAAALGRRTTLWHYAGVTVLLAGMTAPVAYVSGTRAEERVESFWYVEEDQIEEHEELGLIALIVLLVAGATAGLSLWRPTPTLRALFTLAALAAAVVTGMTALEGGEIVHDSPALAERPPAAVAPPR